MEGCPSGMLGQGPVVLSTPGLLQLMKEHGELREQLNDLMSQCNQIEENDDIVTGYQQLIKDVIAAAENVELHSGKEEEYLFPMMEVYLGKGVGPIAVMEYEHEQAKAYIRKFLENAKVEDSLSTKEKIVANVVLVKNAYYTLMDHFAKEEGVLFPMAEKILSAEEKEELSDKVCQ